MKTKLFAFCILVFVAACTPAQSTPLVRPGSTTVQPIQATVAVDSSSAAIPLEPPTVIPSAPATNFPTIAPTTSVPSNPPTYLPTQTATPKPSPTLTQVPTSTPVLAPRMVEMPWGRVNLDLPMEESNYHARSAWCYRDTKLVEADRLALWSTNPMGMLIGRPVPRAMLNVQVISKDADWRADKAGAQYFDAVVIARNTPDQSDTQRFTLRIYFNAPLAVNMPLDLRLNDNFKYWMTFAPVSLTVTDLNQIRVGQIYAVIESILSWGGISSVESHALTVVKQGTPPLGIYSTPVGWETSCEFKKAQGWLK